MITALYIVARIIVFNIVFGAWMLWRYRDAP
jgi:hypothetical protein